MIDFVTLTCPNCGEKVQISTNIDRITCALCSTEYIVNCTEEAITLTPVVDRATSELAIIRLENEISDLNRLIQEITNREGYRKNIFYMISSIISVIFSLASLWAWLEYEVVIWIIFLIAGILIAVMSIIAVRTQSKEFTAQRMKLKDSLEPYQRALERKQKELDYHKTVVGVDKKPSDQ